MRARGQEPEKKGTTNSTPVEYYSLHICYKICYKKSTKGHFYLADVVKMNHVRGSGGGAQIRASHSQSDPVSLGKTTFCCHLSCGFYRSKTILGSHFWSCYKMFGPDQNSCLPKLLYWSHALSPDQHFSHYSFSYY